MPKYEGITIDLREGVMRGKRDGMLFSADLALFLISQAWRHDCDFEDLADGFGEGVGTHGDWSGIRDSSPKAINQMLERTLNHLFSD